MVEKKKYSLEEAQLQFAKKSNGRVWELLDKSERSKDEDEEMLYAAHASLYHWMHAGTGVHRQRGEWMIARVHTVLGNGKEALRHATRCLELTNEHEDLMEDFDHAFANEAVARAYALIGDEEKVGKYIILADKAGQAISDDESRTIFYGDFDGGEWYGYR
jgi:hypothetical protein